MKRQILTVLSAVALLASANIATAAGDAAAGKKKTSMCAGCHGAKGISMAPVNPNLAGQKAMYLANQLKAFRSGDRKNATMNPMSKNLSDEDIANIAAYYAGLK